ncbi:nucleotide disphospho-sugar-binding domain-containing protein [Saccharopolyspora sp. CA-218241]|uniref:nucleotide disphospho-sugar-binding domain-containing protein n=1 Tax=Saccharopolyspora sp. CA-218241 TaxID=3240027 RepID=UPI003D997CE6
MRVLISSTDGISKLFPLVPLAWAFRAAGHEVLVTFAEQLDQARTTGLQVVDVAPGFDGMAILGKAIEDEPELAAIWADPLGDDPGALSVANALLNRPFLDRTLDLAERWRPDLVVYEQTATYGLITAAHLGVPAVQRNLGLIRTGELHQATCSRMPDVHARIRTAELPSPARIFEYVPPSMLPFPTPEGDFLRELPFTGGTALEDPSPAPPDRARIAITMGSTKPGTDGLGPMAATIEAASQVDAEFILALGAAADGPLPALPANVRVIGWTPLDVLLRGCTAIIHHGGSMTAMAAIDAGIPQLLALPPQSMGNKTVGPGVRHRGVGMIALEDEVDVGTVERLLSDEQMRLATGEVRTEMHGLPTPAEVVPGLVELAS